MQTEHRKNVFRTFASIYLTLYSFMFVLLTYGKVIEEAVTKRGLKVGFSPTRRVALHIVDIEPGRLQFKGRQSHLCRKGPFLIHISNKFSSCFESIQIVA